MECVVFSGPAPPEERSCQWGPDLQTKGHYGDHLETPNILHMFLQGEFSSVPSVLPVKGQKAPLCVIWKCASFVQQASGRPNDESLSNERTAWLRNTRSGMITRHGTDLISSMPDFLQMVWVDTKKQLKLTTTSGLMTNKKSGGYTGATDEWWCVTCLMVYSADPRLHYEPVLNSFLPPQEVEKTT